MTICIIVGATLVLWGVADFYAGQSWFVDTGGFAKFTMKDDGYVFWMVAGFKVVAGMVWIYHM